APVSFFSLSLHDALPIFFILMSLSGGSENIENLIKFGANSKIFVAEGEWWRLFTASFIHIGFFHILFNMYFFYSLGPIFEKMFRSEEHTSELQSRFDLVC